MPLWIASRALQKFSRVFNGTLALRATRAFSSSPQQGIENVPVIDISNLSRSNGCPVAKQIGEACRTWGFFQITGHGVPKEEARQFREITQSFFELPLEAKQRIKRTTTNSRGFYDDELTKQRRDWKQGFDFGCQDGSLSNVGQDGYNQWPLADLPAFKGIQEAYFLRLEAVARRLLEGVALSLGAHHRLFEPSFVGNHTSYLRLNYYPVCPDPAAALGVHHHTDAGALTVLYQDDVAALQVCKEGAWHTVPPVDHAFVINVGDMMQVWTNGLYKAPVHRVLANGAQERYSAPFFYNPAYHTNVSALPMCKGEEELYDPINWGQFRASRFNGDFSDNGEEVQISHYLKSAQR